MKRSRTAAAAASLLLLPLAAAPASAAGDASAGGGGGWGRKRARGEAAIFAAEGDDDDAGTRGLRGRRRRPQRRPEQQRRAREESEQPQQPQRPRPPQRRRRLPAVSRSYLEAHPYYPSHDLLLCLHSVNDGEPQPPAWMTRAGGYAEAHLFETGEACCARWFPDVDGCFERAAEGRIIDAMAGLEGEGATAAEGSEADEAPARDGPMGLDLAGDESANAQRPGSDPDEVGGIESSNWSLRPPSGPSGGESDGSNMIDAPVDAVEDSPRYDESTLDALIAANGGGSGAGGRPSDEGDEEGAAEIISRTDATAASFAKVGPGADYSDAVDPAVPGENDGLDVSEHMMGHGAPVSHNSAVESHDYVNLAGAGAGVGAGAVEKTFPTSACGSGWKEASTCSWLCLDGKGCPHGMSCYPGISCPASQVASAMGSASASVLSLVGGTHGGVSTDACGKDYADAEARCRAGTVSAEDPLGLGFRDDFASCAGTGWCPEGEICFGGIACPPPPTTSPAPTRGPAVRYEFNHGKTDGGGEGGTDVVAYYASWRRRDRSKLAQPRNLNYDLISRVNYAYFRTDADGRIWGADPSLDPAILFGEPSDPVPGAKCAPGGTYTNDAGCKCHRVGPDLKSCDFHDEGTGLLHLAHEKGVDVYVGVGGWTLSDKFPEMAATRRGREGFAESVVELILEYGFDGVDVSWEYPGYLPHSGTSDDPPNFVLLLHTIRSALDALGRRTGRRYGLTAALPCLPSLISNFSAEDATALADLLDGWNLRSYDLHGPWDPVTGHHAPLYDPLKSGLSVQGCVENWVGKNSRIESYLDRDAARRKVNLGLPFFGRSYLDATEMGARHGGNDAYSWPDDDGSPTYYNIIEKVGEGEMTSVRDETTKAAYAYFDDGYGMVSYEDPRSMCDKVEYATNEGLGGFVIWDISGDMMDDFRQPLLEAVNRKLALPDIDCRESFADPVQLEASSKASSGSTVPIPLAVVEEPIVRGDKAEIVGVPIIAHPPPAPGTVPAPAPLITSSQSSTSPYTIDVSSFGSLPVAAETCQGGCPSSSQCVGNAASGQLIQDSECAACSDGQTWWPCDVDGLCWCWKDGTDRIAPALGSGLDVEVDDPNYTVCDDILSRDMFHSIAPEARPPYTYEGLCDAILSYNLRHTEKAFGMGDAFVRTAELAAFLGNTLHESDEYRAGREYLMCADNVVVDGEVYCKPCDNGSFDWGSKTCGHSLVSGTAGFNEYCQPSSKPPEACHCGSGASVGGNLDGYVPARDLFFGRGAIQLSWNYNYIGASVALTGSPDTFCDNPDVVATEGRYAWGAGLYFWMEHVKEGATSHTESLMGGGDFGGTLNNINGGLECPAHGGWHVEAVKARLGRYCRAAKALGLPNILRLDNCAGLQESMDACLSEGTCADCQHYVGTTPSEHVSNFVVAPALASAPAPAPVPAPVPDGTAETIDLEPAGASETSCPDGLMPWSENPDCCVPNSAFVGDGACDPDAPYNTAACGYDGGDCCKASCDWNTAFGCSTKEGDAIGGYGPFGFYCVDPSEEATIDPNLCNVEEKYRVGDGRCNPALNTPGCNYDGGDCCQESCDDFYGYFDCGSGLLSYLCIDPMYTSEPTPSPTQRPATMHPTLHPTTKEPTPPPQQVSMPPPPTSSNGNLLGSGGNAAMVCPMDLMRCPTGTYMARNPMNNCAFDPCPVITQGQSVAALSKPEPPEDQPTGTNVIVDCGAARMECPDGTFIKQDPSNDCKFFPCPEVISHDPSLSQEQTECDSARRECPDGTFVGKDAKNGCQFFPCKGIVSQEQPSDGSNHGLASSISAAMHGKNNFMQQADFEDTSKPTGAPTLRVTGPAKSSLAASINGLMSAGRPQPKCREDVLECEGGEYVGRDPLNGCEFFECPVADANSINSYMQGTGQSDPEPKCKADLLECEGGEYMGRDQSNGCEFFECPRVREKETAGSSLATSIGASFLQGSATSEAQEACADDAKQCPDGSSVGRDMDNGCRFLACPKSEGPLASSISSSFQQAAECEDDLIECPDGSFVGRDPDAGCQHFPCPTTKPTLRPTHKSANVVSAASSMHSKYSPQSQCTGELFKCSDGTFVGRDPDHGCEFFKCSEGDMTIMSGTLDMAGGKPGHKEDEGAYLGGGVQVHHRKKNGSRRGA
ncbi:hypothetical protein ACHAWF_016039 [Thalassiosira exigua]